MDEVPKVCLYWSGPRVSDIQDCDGLFDGAITLYGYEKDPTYGEFYGTLKQSLSDKSNEGLFDNPNFCNSSFNIKDGECIYRTRINHNLKSTIEDFFILLYELDVIIEKENVNTKVRFMTYNPNYVSRYGNCDYILLLTELIRDFNSFDADRTQDRGKFTDCRKPKYAGLGVSEKDTRELFDRLIFEDDSKYKGREDLLCVIKRDREVFKKVKTFVEEEVMSGVPVQLMTEDLKFIDKAKIIKIIMYSEEMNEYDEALPTSKLNFTEYSSSPYCTEEVYKAINPKTPYPSNADRRTERAALSAVSEVTPLYESSKKHLLSVCRDRDVRKEIENAEKPAELVKAIKDDKRLRQELEGHLKGALHNSGAYLGCGMDVMPQVVCDIILDHMICMNQDEEIMHILDHKDRFRKLCRKLEVGTTEGDLFILPGSFVEEGKTLLNTAEACKKECGACESKGTCKPYGKYAAKRDELFADLKKKVSGSRIVVQEVQSSGGFGTYLIERSEDLDTITRDLFDAASMRGDEDYDKKRLDYIVSRYRSPNIPVNIHAIITEYDIILLPPSIQNIMVLNHKLIYSGADFYAYDKYAERNRVRDSEFKEYTTWICRSIQNRGYRGVIGFDAIVSDGGIEFVEANNRFQASTVLINKALREQRYLRSKEGFPIRRIDGKMIRHGEIIPSVQALNLMSFVDTYDTYPFGLDYDICGAIIEKFDPKIVGYENIFTRYSGIINTKVPYSCVIYYEDERSFSEGVAKKHYLHMIKRVGEIRRRYSDDTVFRVAAVLKPIFENIVSLTYDFNEFAMGKGGSGGSPTGAVGNTFFSIIKNTIMSPERYGRSGIRDLLRLVHNDDIRYCSKMEHTIVEYCNGKYKPSNYEREQFQNACESLKGIFSIRDDFVDYDNKLRKQSEETGKSSGNLNVFLFFWEEPYTLLDDISIDNIKTGERLMREIDRILSADECTMKEPAPCDIFDNDLESNWIYKKAEDKDYCRPGSYAVKLIFARNVLSVLNTSVMRDPNIMPPSIKWYRRITEREILPVKIGLINNGVDLPGDLDGIREGVNHSVDLTFTTDTFSYNNRNDCTSIDINCEYGTPTSAFSPFSVVKDVKGDTAVSLLYYGDPLGIVGSYEPPIKELEEKRLPGSGIPLSSMAFVATDRVRFQHSDRCRYASIGRGCKFCEFTASKESTSGNTHYSFGEEEILGGIRETHKVLKNVQSNIHVDHVLIGGGTMLGNPSDVKARIIKMCREIKDTFGKDKKKGEKMGIYLMCTPPAVLSDMDDFREAGVTEVSFNIEVYDHHLAGEYMPGKRSTSTSGYIAALRYATDIWGKEGNVRSALIVGLEDRESTMDGIRALASIGVAPILSIFRPTPGTELEWMKPFDSETIFEFYLKADKECEGLGMEFGPKCLHCQNNTLVLPRDLKEKRFVI